MTKPVNPKPSSRTFATVTIASGASQSDVVNLTGLTLSSIQMSTAWTDARIGFQANCDGSTNYFNVYGSTGDLLTYAATASHMLIFAPAVFAGVQTLRLVSESSAGVGVNQGAARTLKLGLAEFVNAD